MDNLQELSKLREEAKKNHIPILRENSAKFLSELIEKNQPKRVLEIGTGIGYSGLIILLNSDARLYTIEHNEKSLLNAKKNFTKFNVLDRVTFYFSDESEIVPLIKGEFDFIFLDGAKTRYIHHLPYLKKLLKVGGLLLSDNIFFNGMVTGENKKIGKKASIVENLKEFIYSIQNDTELDTKIYDFDDGMSLSKRLI